jgi:hypothetical protein
MDAKTRAILLIKYKPMIEGFKNAIAEERKKGTSDARLAAILQYVETTSSGIDPDAMELMRIELAEAAKATNRGPGSVQREQGRRPKPTPGSQVDTHQRQGA